MMEESTQLNIYERPKKKGRPKGTAIFTPEEAKERARQRAILYYSLNFEKERERKRMEYHAKEKCYLIYYYFYCFHFVNFHLKN